MTVSQKALTILALIAQVHIANAQVVSEWRGLSRTGVYSSEKNLLKKWPVNGPKLEWHLDSLPKGYASVAVTQQKVFTTGTIDTMDVVIAVDHHGSKLWKTSYGRAWDGSYEYSRCTPTIENDRMYLTSGLGDMACLDTKDGTIIWTVKAAEVFNGASGHFGYSESALIVGDLIYFTVGGNKTTIIALNKNTGKTAWKSESIADQAGYSSPLHIKNKSGDIIINFTENYLFAIKAQTGKILWKYNFGKHAGGKRKRKNRTNTPLFHNNELFITSGYDHKSVMLKLADDASSVSEKWIDSTLDVHHGGVVHVDGYIYGANWIHNRKGNWVCLDWKTGTVKYEQAWGNKGSIIAADGMLYCYEEKSGKIGLVPATSEKFDVVSSFKAPYGKGPYWSHPVIHNGRLYLRSSTSLMVFNIRHSK